MRLADLQRYLPDVEKELARAYARERRTAPLTARPYLDVNEEFTLRGGKRFRAL